MDQIFILLNVSNPKKNGKLQLKEVDQVFKLYGSKKRKDE